MAAMKVLTALTALGGDASGAGVGRLSCFNSDNTSRSADYDSGPIKSHVQTKDFVCVIPGNSNNKKPALNLRNTEVLKASRLELEYSTNATTFDGPTHSAQSSKVRYILN